MPDTLNSGSGRISGTAFFPGGDGVLKPRLSDTIPDIFVIGRDCGTLDYFGSCVRDGCERETQPTWRALLERLRAASVDPERCYFTNAFVGYRKTGRNTDQCAAHSERNYAARCRALLAFQIEILKPRSILVLGKDVPAVLSRLSPDLRAWSSTSGFRALDRSTPVVFDATFGQHRASACVLVHPSKAWLNVKHRRYTDCSGVAHIGVDAELAMIRDIVAPASAR